MCLLVARDVVLAVQGYPPFVDDAWYYSVVARNLAAGGGPTFDGVSPTTGFHPAWMAVQTAGFALGFDRLTTNGQGVALAILQASLILGSVFVLVAVARRAAPDSLVPSAAVLAAALLTNHPFWTSIANGMESVLVAPLMAAFLWQALRRNVVQAAWVGAALVASRLDTVVFVVAPTALWLCAREAGPWTVRARSLMRMMTPSLLLAAGYMGLLQALFGHATPISGRSKSAFPWPAFHGHLLSDPLRDGLSMRTLLRLDDLTPWLPVTFGVLVVVLLLRRGRLSCPVLSDGAKLGVSLALIQAANLVLFQKWDKPPETWYYPTIVVGCCFALASAWTLQFGALAAGRLSILVTGVMAARLVATLLFQGTQLPPAELARREVAEFMRSTASSTIWAATDAGRLAFLGERRTVNLDGLINGEEYQEAIRDGEFARWVESIGVRYLILHVWADRQQYDEPMYESRSSRSVFDGTYDSHTVTVYSHIFGRRSDPLVVRREQEVFRSDFVFMDGNTQSRYIVFDLESAAPRGDP